MFPRREGNNKGKQKKRPTFTKTAWIPAIVFPPGPTGIPPVPAVCTKIFFSLNIWSKQSSSTVTSVMFSSGMVRFKFARTHAEGVGWENSRLSALSTRFEPLKIL